MIREQAVTSDSAAWLGIVSNVTLAVFKGVAGLFFDSRALLADALYSASDAAAGIAEKIQLPKAIDKQKAYLYGGRRNGTAEPLIACFLAVFLFMGALQVIITSIASMFSGNLIAPGYISGIAIVISIALKEVIFQIQHFKHKNQRENSSRSYIEMHRNSLYCSVIVLLGVSGAMAGDQWGVQALLYLDPAAALAAACLVLWRSYRLITGALYAREQSNVHKEDKSQYVETVQRVHGVITVDELKLQDNGHYISVIVIISVNPRISVLEANHIVNRAKILLLNRFPQVSDVSIQVMPYDPGYPYKSNYEGSNNDMPTLLQ